MVFDKLFESIKDLLEREYSRQYGTTDAFTLETMETYSTIPIIETEWSEHENFTIDVYFDINNMALKKCLHGDKGLTYTEAEWYNIDTVAIENIRRHDFDSLTTFNKTTEWLIDKLS